jgi:hypothetical protein
VEIRDCFNLAKTKIEAMTAAGCAPGGKTGMGMPGIGMPLLQAHLAF